MSSFASNWKSTGVKTTQAAVVHNPNPPNMVSIKTKMLESASPKFFSLPAATGTDTTSSDAAIDFCRKKYTGFGGLRKLQLDQKNQTYYDPGCGWRFQLTPGSIHPKVNQAAYGIFKSPMRPGKGSPDEIGGGITWNMELDQAERTASEAIATSLNNKCTNLQYLSDDNKPYFGFCSSSGSIIPIQTDSKGIHVARFPNTTGMGCPPANIVPATFAPSGCSASASASASASTSGFRNYQENFTSGLTSINDLDNCTTSPLTRDCIVLAARASGCDTKGSLIAALDGIGANDDYNRILKDNMAYKTYSALVNPGITSAITTNGAGTLATVLNDFASLAKNSQSSQPKIAAASRDLCENSGYFDKAYDWCSELTPTSVINSDTLPCAQSFWKNQGGTAQGTAYPTIGGWSGKTFQALNTFVQNLVTRINSQDKATQDSALMQFIGTSSGYVPPVITPNVDPTLPSSSKVLEKNAKTNGAETVWFDMGDYWNGKTPPMIIRCDLMNAENGEVIPTLVNDYTDVTVKYKLPNLNSIAFMNAFEYRHSYATTLQFNVVTDDGFMLSINQNPFEKTAYAKNDWGSWRYQPRTPYRSGIYNISAESDTERNVVVTKFFQGQGGAHFVMNISEGGNTWKDQSLVTEARANMFITQEPNAPWMQYEICSRPNNGKGTAVGFFEKRWNGPIAYYENQGVDKPIPSFDAVSSGVVAQTDNAMTYTVPGGKGFLTFTSGSWWRTVSMFAYTAFKTITLLVRPSANLAASSQASIFSHISPSAELAVLHLATDANGNYVFYLRSDNVESTTPCVPNEWNLVVIQYNGDAKGITNVQVDAMDLPTLQTNNGVAQFFTRIVTHQSRTGSYIMKPPMYLKEQPGSTIRDKFGGYLNLGGASDLTPQQGQGFTGDIAWIHGFRDVFSDIASLKSEVTQSWVSRWPRPNLELQAARQQDHSLGLLPKKPNCTSPHGNGVTIRENCDSRSGWSQVLPVGEYDLTKVPGMFPADASYIIVPSGFKATIFTGPLDQGRSKSFEGPTEWSFCTEGWWANDKIRSIRVTSGAGNVCHSENAEANEKFRNYSRNQPIAHAKKEQVEGWTSWANMPWGRFKW